jgi:hypothetical protein
MEFKLHGQLQDREGPHYVASLGTNAFHHKQLIIHILTVTPSDKVSGIIEMTRVIVYSSGLAAFVAGKQPTPHSLLTWVLTEAQQRL